MSDRFTMTEHADFASARPLLPAQSAVAFVLRSETWPVFRAWLQSEAPYNTTDEQDRADMERAFAALIKSTGRPTGARR